MKDRPELEVLLVPQLTNTGVGIGQDGDELVALSGCCEEDIVYGWADPTIGATVWRCAHCNRRYTWGTWLEEAPVCKVLWGHQAQMLYWVSKWTGLHLGRLDMKLESPS